MTNEQIIKNYKECLNIIETHGFKNFKKWIEENKSGMNLSILTIATSIIAMFDILEKK